MEEITRYNAADVRKKDAERKQVEALKNTTFGSAFIDKDTGKPNKALAAFMLFGMVAGMVIGEWYGATNDWPMFKRRILFFYVTWGFPLGALAGAVYGILNYKLFNLLKKKRS